MFKEKLTSISPKTADVNAFFDALDIRRTHNRGLDRRNQIIYRYKKKSTELKLSQQSV